MKKWILGSLALVLLSAGVVVARLDAVLQWAYEDSVMPVVGKHQVEGLQRPVQIRRDELGIPLIEAESLADLAFGVGYAMAADRLEQMVGFTLAAQGRLAEMAGPVVLDLDVYMRTLGVDQIAQTQYKALRPDTRRLLEQFSAGVNAYLESHRNSLPFGLAMANYQPEPWQPLDSLRIFAIINLGLSMNSHEELQFLQFAQRVGVEKAAWLMPVYPDEPLPFDEAAKLAGLELGPLEPQLTQLQTVQQRLAGLFPRNLAASNNWAVHKDRTRNGASILANDTHLFLSQPPLWMLMQVRSPEYSAGGIALAGIPGIVGGYNGHVAWGMTMVMADSEDIFLEELREIDGRLHYRVGERWEPVLEREEVFHIKGGVPVTRIVRATRHGPLLNDAIAATPHNSLQPYPLSSRYGLALSQTSAEADQTVEAILRLGQAKSLAEAGQAIDEINFIHLNMVYADRDDIGWRVTGRYPQRAKGTGQLPSLGWSGEYDWQGFVPAEQRPWEENPAAGFVATANHRTVKEPGFTISSSWYYPERYERIAQQLGENPQQDAESTFQLQFDQRNPLVGKLQALWREPAQARELEAAIANLPDAQQRLARETYEVLLAFDGWMRPESREATYFGAFEHVLTRALFLDELGPESTPAWQALITINGYTYGPLQDHELGREDSPFWDDLSTTQTETKTEILARALAQTPELLTQRLGPDRSQWQWGKLHTYTWRSSATEMKPYLGTLEQGAVELLSDYLDRGPFPAGGDRNTVNVAGHSTGQAFDVWNIPAMRLVVDFSQDEPLWVINSGGQSGNPSSPHYDDGIAIWLTPRNRQMSWQLSNAHNQYNRVFWLEPRR